MKPSVALRFYYSAVQEAFQAHPSFTNPRIFGSVVDGTDRDGSDLDILVEGAEGASLFELIALEQEISRILGLNVDLREPEELSLKFRSAVVASAVPLEKFCPNEASLRSL